MAISCWWRTDSSPKLAWWVLRPWDIYYKEVETYQEALDYLSKGPGEIKRNPNQDVTFWRNYDDGRKAVQVTSVEQDAYQHGLQAIPDDKYPKWNPIPL